MTTTRRISTAIIAAAALLPASAQAMPDPGPVVHESQSAPQPVLVEPAPPDDAFDWGSAELGGMSVALLLAAGAGSTLLVRRRRAHAPVIG